MTNGPPPLPTRTESELLEVLKGRPYLLLVSGDATLRQTILQTEHKTFDRFIEGQKIETYLVPTGTFMLEYLLRTFQARQFPDNTPYAIHGPLSRTRFKPHDVTSSKSVYKFSTDAVVISRFPVLRSDKLLSKTDTLRIEQKLGNREFQSSTASSGVGEKNGANFMAREGIALKAFVNLITLEFQYFGKRDICATIGTEKIEKALEDGVEPFYVIKIRDRECWKDSYDAATNEIRSNIRQFLVGKVGAQNMSRSTYSCLVISADELRQGGLPISRELSWERTIQTLVTNMISLTSGDRIQSPFSYLPMAKFVVITFGADAAILIEFGDQPINSLGHREVKSVVPFIDSSSLEGDFSTSVEGTIRGFDTILSASIAHHVLDHKISGQNVDIASTIHKALLFGLQASRCYLLRGFVKTPTEYKVKEDSPLSNSIQDEFLAAMKDQDKGEMSLGNTVDFHNKFTYTHSFAGENPITRGMLLNSKPAYWYNTWFQARRFVETVVLPITARDYEIFGDIDHLLECPVIPFDFISHIVVFGSMKEAEWIPFELDEKIRRPLIEELNVWRNICRSIGYLKYSSLTDHRVNKLYSRVESEYKSDNVQNIFDRNFWTFLGDAIPVNLMRTLIDGDKREDECRVIAGQIMACFVLLKGANGLVETTMPNENRLGKPEFIDVLVDYLVDESMASEKGDLSSARGKVLDKVCEGFSKLSRVDVSDLGSKLDEVKQLGSQKFSAELLKVLGMQSPGSPSWIGLTPGFTMGKLNVLDRREAEGLRFVVGVLQEFKQTKGTKPLNVGVFGPAGSGKSFAVQEIVKNVFGEEAIELVNFNLSQLRSPSDLYDAFEETQDIGLKGKVPIVFWDEFDTSLNGQALGWLSYFLGPMNDGMYFRNERSRRLPRSVFIFAGSLFASRYSMEVLHKIANSADQELYSKVGNFSPAEWLAAKGSDFKSRITASLDVLGVNQPQPVRGVFSASVNPAQAQRLQVEFHSAPQDINGIYLRRAVVLRHNLMESRRDLFDSADNLRIDIHLAKALLRMDSYMHGARSLEQIVRMSKFGNRKVFELSAMPPESQLSMQTETTAFESEMGWF